MNASNGYRYDSSRDPRDGSLRVGDKERDAVSEILRQAHGEGRLDEDEFQTRLESCLTAKTYADLDVLIADFPREGADAGATRRRAVRRFWPTPFVFLPLAVIAAIAFGAHVAWLAIPLIFLFVVRPLLWRGRGWGCGPMWARRVP